MVQLGLSQDGHVIHAACGRHQLAVLLPRHITDSAIDRAAGALTVWARRAGEDAEPLVFERRIRGLLVAAAARSCRYASVA